MGLWLKTGVTLFFPLLIFLSRCSPGLFSFFVASPFARARILSKGHTPFFYFLLSVPTVQLHSFPPGNYPVTYNPLESLSSISPFFSLFSGQSFGGIYFIKHWGSLQFWPWLSSCFISQRFLSDLILLVCAGASQCYLQLGSHGNVTPVFFVAALTSLPGYSQTCCVQCIIDLTPTSCSSLLSKYEDQSPCSTSKTYCIPGINSMGMICYFLNSHIIRFSLPVSV